MRKHRKPDEMRPIEIEVGFTRNAPGSVLLSWGRTKVLATVSIVDGVPEFLAGKGRGWLTAEYGMLPGSVAHRKPRSRGFRIDGRSTEIQRLIGRSLRGVLDLKALGERTLYVDCDVLEADGGTRVASISASCVALGLAVQKLARSGRIQPGMKVQRVAAVSVGIVAGRPLLDLDAGEDQNADVDMNVVMRNARKYIEVQGTAERSPFSDEDLEKLLALAKKGIRRIDAIQRAVLAGAK